MYLLIDDERDIPCDIIARTYGAGVDCLRRLKLACAIFDHDLGELDDRRNGYDLMLWAVENGFLPNRVQIITSNPVGRAKMQQLLEAEGYTTDCLTFKVDYYKGD